MKFLRNHILYIVVTSLLVSLSSCNYNGINYKFSDEDNISIEMNMTDTTSIFDLYIAYRLSENYEKDSLPLILDVISPSNLKYSETVILPSCFFEMERYLIFFPEKEDEIKIIEGPVHYDIQWKYRKDIIPLEPGIWKISLKSINEDDNLIGLGVHYNERKRQNTEI